MVLSLSEDEVDDLLYFARTGDKDQFDTLTHQLCARETTSLHELLNAAKDEHTSNGVLHMAAANGHEELLRAVCKTLSDPSPQNPAMLSVLNSQNHSGNTALHWAALNGHLESVKVLLEAGADPTIANQRGHDAVYEAELNDQKEVVEWVLKEGGEGLEEGLGGENIDQRAEDADTDEVLNESSVTTEAEGASKIEEKLGEMDIREVSKKI